MFVIDPVILGTACPQRYTCILFSCVPGHRGEKKLVVAQLIEHCTGDPWAGTDTGQLFCADSETVYMSLPLVTTVALELGDHLFWKILFSVHLHLLSPGGIKTKKNKVHTSIWRYKHNKDETFNLTVQICTQEHKNTDTGSHGNLVCCQSAPSSWSTLPRTTPKSWNSSRSTVTDRGSTLKVEFKSTNTYHNCFVRLCSLTNSLDYGTVLSLRLCTFLWYQAHYV